MIITKLDWEELALLEDRIESIKDTVEAVKDDFTDIFTEEEMQVSDIEIKLDYIKSKLHDKLQEIQVERREREEWAKENELIAKDLENEQRG